MTVQLKPESTIWEECSMFSLSIFMLLFMVINTSRTAFNTRARTNKLTYVPFYIVLTQITFELIYLTMILSVPKLKDRNNYSL